MSVFGKYGVGGPNPGKYTAPPGEDDSFAFDTAALGTDSGQPDSKPESAAGTFGAAEHNKGNMNPKGSS